MAIETLFFALLGFLSPANRGGFLQQSSWSSCSWIPWMDVLQPSFLYFVCGIVPFGALFTEFFFFISSLWRLQFYCLFSFTSDAGLRPTRRNLVGFRFLIEGAPRARLPLPGSSRSAVDGAI